MMHFAQPAGLNIGVALLLLLLLTTQVLAAITINSVTEPDFNYDPDDAFNEGQHPILYGTRFIQRRNANIIQTTLIPPFSDDQQIPLKVDFSTTVDEDIPRLREFRFIIGETGVLVDSVDNPTQQYNNWQINFNPIRQPVRLKGKDMIKIKFTVIDPNGQVYQSQSKEMWENGGIMGLDVIEMKLVPCNGDDDDDDDDDDV